MLSYLGYGVLYITFFIGQLSADVHKSQRLQSQKPLYEEKPKKKPFVTCNLHGQLGNQLYEIATTLAYAWDHDAEPIFPELKKNNFNIPMNRERIFFRLNASLLPRSIKYTFTHKNNFEKKEIPVRPDQNLHGFFQTWEYFDHHRQKLINIFAPRPEELKKIQTKHAELLKHSCTIGVHVRTFNKPWAKLIPFVGLSYYEDAISVFPANALFVIFSDRINWAKHHFKKFNRPMIFIEGQDHIEDFFLMSMLKHNVIGNSSFSWWAAYLNKNPNKVVIAPSHFIRPNEKRKLCNANMPDWFVLDIDCNAPYPDDMYSYDAYSASLDTQNKED